jgi:plastocyanin
MIAVLLVALQMFSISGSASRAVAVWVSGPASAPAPGTFAMHNINRTFTPSSIVVPVGSQVRFPNDDPFEHSIYSADRLNAFDIGYYGTGPGKYVTFSHAGVVQVRCHIHTYMRGMIVVAGGPYAQVNGAGGYEIGNLPAGGYTVHEITDDGVDHTEHLTLERNTTLNF